MGRRPNKLCPSLLHLLRSAWVSANGFKGVQYVCMGRWPFVYGSVAVTINHVSVSVSVSLSIPLQYLHEVSANDFKGVQYVCIFHKDGSLQMVSKVSGMCVWVGGLLGQCQFPCLFLYSIPSIPAPQQTCCFSPNISVRDNKILFSVTNWLCITPFFWGPRSVVMSL